MGLKQQLLKDLQQALRDRATERKSAIRLVLAAITYEEIAKQRELSDDETLALVRREVRQHHESLSEFEKAGRMDLVATQRAELAALEAYLPPQLSEEEIVRAAQQAIAETDAVGPGALGQVMRVLMPRLKGKADGETVNRVVRELLSSED